MQKRVFKYILMLIAGLTCFAVSSHAQFKEEAFQQTYNEPGTYNPADTAAKLFSVKEYIGGLQHKNTIPIANMFAGSVVLPGTAQIYNKDYWKLPVVYGGIGALAGTGGYYLHKYNLQKKEYTQWEGWKAEFEVEHGMPYPVAAPELNQQFKKTGTWLMAGAGLLYWGSLLDGVINYESDTYPLAGRATLYSLLLPGLGQIYNGEFYKVPIYWGGLMISTHCYMFNKRQYQRFKRIHNEASEAGGSVQNIPAETAKWYRDVYRRYRDYSILSIVAVYVLQVMDANVFAYMHDFEVSDDIAMRVEPAVIQPDTDYAMNVGSYGMGQNAFGVRLGFTF